MNIQYVVYCEDEAQRLFLQSAIPSIVKTINSNISIELDSTFKLRPNTKPKFNSIFKDATRTAFRNYRTNLFVLCFDSDSPLEKDFERQRNEWANTIIREIPEHKNKFILAVPVQAIEHWLFYINSIKKEPSKLKSGVFESIPTRELKNKLYNSDKYISRTCEPIVQKLISDLSTEIFKSLRSNSFSFNFFYTDLESFLKHLKKS